MLRGGRLGPATAWQIELETGLVKSSHVLSCSVNLAKRHSEPSVKRNNRSPTMSIHLASPETDPDYVVDQGS